jgi:dynein heavy chain
MRRTMIFKTSDFLNRELFILDKELAKPLMNIRNTTFRVTAMDVVKIMSEQPRNSQMFYDEQSQQRKYLEHNMLSIENEIKKKLIEACEKSMKTFKEENRISISEGADAAGADDNDEAEPFLVGDETHKQMPYTQEATTRTHYRRLTKYIRMVDFMVVDAKLTLLNNNV